MSDDPKIPPDTSKPPLKCLRARKGPHFSSNLEARQWAMKSRGPKIDDIKRWITRRPKNICPCCFSIHKEFVPDECWIKAGKQDYSGQTEFAKYLQVNKLGRFDYVK